mmetsp:Transcript_30302/g.59182  ORF Transcript_30302/g.59182 Transcript_30302/m.59182 type:complete len:244 (-) Transcript_30302:1035-1766(-)
MPTRLRCPRRTWSLATWRLLAAPPRPARSRTGTRTSSAWPGATATRSPRQRPHPHGRLPTLRTSLTATWLTCLLLMAAAHGPPTRPTRSTSSTSRREGVLGGDSPAPDRARGIPRACCRDRKGRAALSALPSLSKRTIFHCRGSQRAAARQSLQENKNRVVTVRCHWAPSAAARPQALPKVWLSCYSMEGRHTCFVSNNLQSTLLASPASSRSPPPPSTTTGEGSISTLLLQATLEYYSLDPA